MFPWKKIVVAADELALEQFQRLQPLKTIKLIWNTFIIFIFFRILPKQLQQSRNLFIDRKNNPICDTFQFTHKSKSFEE